MSRLQEMKSKGLDKVTVAYSRSSFFGQGMTMQEVLDRITSSATQSVRKHTSKTAKKTWRSNMKV